MFNIDLFFLSLAAVRGKTGDGSARGAARPQRRARVGRTRRSWASAGGGEPGAGSTRERSARGCRAPGRKPRRKEPAPLAAAARAT